MAMHPAPDGFMTRDIAAGQLSAILRDARIAHIFVGGYAASLLGSSRVPRAIDVIVERSPSSVLEEFPQFARYPSGRTWIFKGDSGPTVRIRFLHPGKEAWFTPDPRKTKSQTIYPHDLANRNLCSRVNIVHPTILLTMKLSIWADAKDDDTELGQNRAEAHYEDIMAILKWHQDNKLIINRKQFPEMTYNARRRFYKLCKETDSARNLVCACFSSRDFRDIMLD